MLSDTERFLRAENKDLYSLLLRAYWALDFAVLKDEERGEDFPESEERQALREISLKTRADS